MKRLKKQKVYYDNEVFVRDVEIKGERAICALLGSLVRLDKYGGDWRVVEVYKSL